MTRARRTAKGLVTPPFFHRWMEAALLLCVSLVQGVVSTLQMILNRSDRDWHTAGAHDDLPRATSGIHAPAFIFRDDRRFAPIPPDEAGGRSTESRSPGKHTSIEALMVSSTQSVRPSNHAGGLIARSQRGGEHSPPAPSPSKDVGMSGALCGVLRLAQA